MKSFCLIFCSVKINKQSKASFGYFSNLPFKIKKIMNDLTNSMVSLILVC